MNTAVVRRLALGDCVVWVGENDYQPGGPGTIISITAHQVEVLWENETQGAIAAHNCITFDTRSSFASSMESGPPCLLTAKESIRPAREPLQDLR